MNASNKPALRFKGFYGEWEEKKLSNIATMHARIGWQNLRTSEFLDSGDYMLITGTDFVDGTVNFDNCHYVDRERYEQDKNIQIRNNSILITKDGTLGKVAFVEKLKMPATLNAGVFNVEIKDEKQVNNRYLFQYLKAPFLMDYVNKKATGGTIKHLNQNILVDFTVALPTTPEQEKIGAFFKQVDSLISLHQTKYDKLINIKKSLLEKMFPQHGNSTPTLRFKGFYDEWEEKKLGEVVQTLPFKPFLKEPEQNGVYEVIQQGNDSVIGFANGFPCFDYENTVIFGDHTLSLYKPISPFFVATDGVRILKGNEKMEGYYLLNLLERYKPRTEGYKRYYSILAECSCYIIKKFPEQEKIGKFFQTFDHMLSLTEQKLEMLKNIKKACLEKMFV